MKIRIFSCILKWALIICSILCIITAVRIEYYNHLAGGAIQAKAEQEPHSKWRGGSGFLEARAKVVEEWRKENGIDPKTDLSLTDREAIKERMRNTTWSPSPSDRVGELLESWGLLQFPLAAFLIIGSVVVATSPRIRETIPRWAFEIPTVVGVLAFGLAFYRGYFTSIGM